MKTRGPLHLGLALLLASCGAEGPTGPERTLLTAVPQRAPASPVDITGTWAWTREEHLTFPPFAATFVFGVEPEGRTTVASCVTRGTLELSRVGAVASGDEVAEESECRTLGGQTFALSPSAHVTVQVSGRSLNMSFQGMVLCLVHAVAGDVQGGTARTLAGGGRCVIPGHPRSEVPGFDPPPAGTEVITRWTAVRP